uniref:Eosinophil peroxidase n=1 Tax=Lates calcarifer TaxID=8187 RepID=A0A4W6GA16_LATCA
MKCTDSTEIKLNEMCFIVLFLESGLSRSVIEKAVIEAKATVDAAYQYSRRESINRVRRNAANPADVLRLMKQPIGQTRSVVRAADYMDIAVKLVKRSLGNRHKRSINATDLISDEDLQVVADLTGCSARHRVPSCTTTPNLDKYRTASSVCNNRENTRWGASNIAFTRWLPAEYQDGISLPKGWNPEHRVNNQILPLVREVSNRILSTANADVESDPLYTHLVTIFGQWTDHDLTFTPHSPVIRSFSNGIDCDKSCERTEPCFPIEIPKKDPRFSKHPEECIPFFRSAAGCGSGNTGYIFGASNVRQQMNSLTAFIDVGQVYGSDDTQARFLRDLTTDEGLLRVNKLYNDSGRELLPFTNMGANMCATRARITNDADAEEVPCFLAGDGRSNENIGLTSLHTLLLREHNRLARALAKLNPHWDGERLYQEARKIMGGYFQVLTFRDYLLHIVGPDFIAKQLSTYPGYDDEVDPSISNVFATAAYRFAHLMVQPFMFRLDENYKEHRDYPSPLLHRAFFAPWRVIFEGGLDPIVRGLVGRQAKLNTQDHMMTEELRDRLFKFSADLALDLAALNLQRGRDHGLPGYNKWRKFCGLSQPKNLAELAKVMNNTDLAKKLLDLYGTPDNIDVWLGGVAEPFVRGGRVGPLFACLIATQFEKIRQGDRLWWENDGVFTEAQRKSLRDTSLARIICDNTGITEVPERPFQYRPRGSGYAQCEDIPVFDLSPWKENVTSQEICCSLSRRLLDAAANPQHPQNNAN